MGNYYPYGEARSGTVSNADAFASYYRDSTGLDYAQQRYYTANSGRFMTTDPLQASADPTSPLSWNRFSYVSSNPVNAIDPTGRIMMGLLPLPTLSTPDKDGFNYVNALTLDQNMKQTLTRVDYNISESTKFYARYNLQTELQPFPIGLWWRNGAQVWPQITPRPLIFALTLAAPFTFNMNSNFGVRISPMPSLSCSTCC